MTPLLSHWSYCSLTLSHRYIVPCYIQRTSWFTHVAASSMTSISCFTKRLHIRSPCLLVSMASSMNMWAVKMEDNGVNMLALWHGNASRIISSPLCREYTVHLQNKGTVMLGFLCFSLDCLSTDNRVVSELRVLRTDYTATKRQNWIVYLSKDVF